MWESQRDFQRVWEGWEAGFMAFHAFHTLSFPWPDFRLATLNKPATPPGSMRRMCHENLSWLVVNECIGGDNRPTFLNRTNVKSLDVAQVGDTLYYFSAGFLTFKQSDFTSCLSADRLLLRLECGVAARVSLVAASAIWNPSCVAEAQMRTGILDLSRSIGLVKI